MPARPSIPAVPALAAPAGMAARAGTAQTLPRSGFDVVPLAAAGVVLPGAGLALWRRPHARR